METPGGWSQNSTRVNGYIQIEENGFIILFWRLQDKIQHKLDVLVLKKKKYSCDVPWHCQVLIECVFVCVLKGIQPVVCGGADGRQQQEPGARKNKVLQLQFRGEDGGRWQEDRGEAEGEEKEWEEEWGKPLQDECTSTGTSTADEYS